MILKNARHEHFAHLVAKGEKPTEAYIQAGFSPKAAYTCAARLLKKAQICSRVAEIQANISKVAEEKTGISKAWVLEQLVEIVHLGKAVEPVRGENGEVTGELSVANLSAANKALELIGKEHGMFIDRKEIRTGALDDVPHDEKKAALALIQEELTKRGIGNEPSQSIH